MNELNILLLFTLFFSVIIHEVAHGLTALWQGDDTAEKAGRLTLNPIPHIDLFGTIILPLIFFLSGSSLFLAWAKPVPYNPHNLKNKKWGEAMVALAGPVSNFLLMFVFIGLFYALKNTANNFVLHFFYLAGFLNLFLGFFNLLPVVPLDGSKILFAFLPKSVSIKVRNFLEANYLYIFIIFIIIILNTNFLFFWAESIYSLFW